MLYGQSQEGVRSDFISHCTLLVGFLSLGVLFSLHALLILYFHFSHLVSFSLRTVPNYADAKLSALEIRTSFFLFFFSSW